MKFGGTSIADEDAFHRVTAIVQRQIEHRSAGSPLPVIVVSALSKVTDGLLQVERFIEAGEGDRAVDRLDELAERHVTIASAVTSGVRQAAVTSDLHAEFAALRNLVRDRVTQPELPPRRRDVIAAAGELASSRLLTAALAETGIPATWVDSRQVLVTDAEFTAAVPDIAATCARATRTIAPVTERGEVAVLGGFIGATPEGVTTTLGRGGSDYSAAIFGACLDVAQIEIWTDVDGMLTADPRVVPQARLVPTLSFAEASELAYFGAKVLHPSTILPAVSKGIPVRILNSRQPDRPGTLITADWRPVGGRLTAIACKRDVTVIDLTSTRMFLAYGFLRRVFEVFDRFKTPVDVVTTSEVSVSVTIDDTRRLDDIVEALRGFAQVACERDMAIICAVGEGVHDDPGAFGHAVSAIGGIPLRMVSQAASRRNITFVLRDADAPQAVTRLHERFFESS